MNRLNNFYSFDTPGGRRPSSKICKLKDPMGNKQSRHSFIPKSSKLYSLFLSVVVLQATASGLQDAFSKLCKSIRLTDTQKVLHECAAMHLLWRRGLLRINEGQLKLPDEYWIYYFMGLNNGANVVLNSYVLYKRVLSLNCCNVELLALTRAKSSTLQYLSEYTHLLGTSEYVLLRFQ